MGRVLLEAGGGAVVKKPTQSVGDRYFLRPAQEDGDWGALADYLERDGEITPAIRAFLAQVLRKKIRPRHRPRKAATLTRNLEVAGFVIEQKRRGVRNPIAQAANLFKINRRTVQQAQREFKKLSAEQQDFVLQAKGWKRTTG
jgi:hypothetical protein